MTRKTTRRRVLLGVGTGTTIGLAGCMGSTGNNSGGSNGGNGGSGGNGSGGGSSGDGAASDQQAVSEPLTADGSSTVYPITSKASGYWNSNPPADDKEYWGPKQYGIDTDLALADYWGSLYGFETESSGPPFPTTVGLSHSGVGITKLMKGQVDIGDSSASVKEELPDRESYEKFVDHVVGVDGQPIVVSKEIAEAGVTQISGKELKAIYTGKITNWNQIDTYNGPDKEIQTVCRAEGSGTDTAFRANLFGNPNAPITCDVRKGQNQQVQTLVANADNAIAYLALAFVDENKVPAVALKLNGTIYKLGKNLGAKDYPLSRDLHCYTWKGTSKQEAAFLRMIIHDFGQKNFVAANNYFKLPSDRQKAQLEKLPDTVE